MTVFLNGQFVSEADAKVSVFDRSFLYGDGLFETIRICNNKAFRWQQHLDRLQHGAEFLGIKVPFTGEALTSFVAQLIEQNQMPDALLRLTLSRGVGLRGYSPRGADKPTLVMSLHPIGAPISGSAASGHADSEIGVPIRWRAHTASFRLPTGDAVAQFKTCNKLIQVLARAEAEAVGADEALLVNTDGFVIEAASGNLFWVQARRVCTPPLAEGILRGITRGVVMEICQRLNEPVTELNVRPEDLTQVDAVFLSLSSFGIVELSEINGSPVRRSPTVTKLFTAYSELMRTECA